MDQGIFQRVYLANTSNKISFLIQILFPFLSLYVHCVPIGKSDYGDHKCMFLNIFSPH